MDEALSAGLDDNRIAAAARRVIRQYRAQQSLPADEPADSDTPRRAPDLPGMRLALDDLGQSIDHIHRLLEHREAVFLAALERVDRNLAKASGRIDALADEVSRLASQPTIDVDKLIQEQRATTSELLKEFGNMMALSRAMLDEAQQLQIQARSDTSEDGGRT